MTSILSLGLRMAQDLIRYDLLAQEALRGLVRKVLTDAAKFGLPGDHHFYIAFDTRAPGVRLSQRLREQHPEEMTIVLQHQFWDLAVTEHAFEIGLSFGNVPERLLVPFTALKGFFDPSVQFGLQFEVALEGEAAPKETLPAAPANADLRKLPRGARSEPVETPAGEKPARPAALTPLVKVDETDGEKPAAEVVSLDAFRRK